LNHEIIRVATPADLQLVRQLDLAVFGAEAYNEQQWNSEFGEASFAIWVALAAEKAVGFCSAAIAGDDYEIRKIGVFTPSIAALGVAKTITELCVRPSQPPLLMRKRPAVLIDVAANNTGCAGFLRPALGFQRNCAPAKRYYANGDDAILMQKI
jgi:ribosomal protein S18 acetylase RimI-like enzyme